MLNEVLEYINRGWRIVPIPHQRKRPVALGWQNLTIGVTEAAQHFHDAPPQNVGVILGTASNLVDVDLDHPKALELADQFLPPTATFGRPGKPRSHRIYHVTNPLPTKRHEMPDRTCIVEYRSTGAQTVFPPSTHPSGEAITWEDNTPPADIDGTLLFELVESLASAVSPKGNLNFTACPPPPPTPILTRAMAYLETLPPAISGAGGHKATYHAACECVRFALDDADAWQAMCWYNEHKCQPPWSEKDLRHKLSEGCKTVTSAGEVGKHLQADPLDLPVEFEVKTVAPPVIADAPATPFPEHLLIPPGFVGDLCQWINATAYKPQPVLALANALAFFGAVVGRKVRTPSDLRSNLYCLGVGSSGCGKDHSRKCIKRLCHSAGLTEKLLGGEDLSSDTSILTAVGKNPAILFQLDEIGHLFANIKSFGAAPHLRAIPSTLTKLFSSANTLFLGKEYAAIDRKDLPQPNVCLYGTTVSGKLYDNLTPDEIRDGFLGRMLVFQTLEDDPLERDDAGSNVVPKKLTDTIRCWYERKTASPGTGNIEAITDANPITVTIEPGAATEFKLFQARCREEKARYRDDSGFDALWARGPEHAQKVALVIAAGCDYASPSITPDIARWAVGIVEHCLNDLIYNAARNVARNQYEKNVQTMLRVIEKAGADGVTASMLVRKCQHIDGRGRNSILQDLLEQDRITASATSDSKTKPVRVYRSTIYRNSRRLVRT